MTEEEKDPDYNEFHRSHHVDRSKIREEDTKKQTVIKIEKILTEQFDSEIEAKSFEISNIDRHIRQTKSMLDRLRAYVVASYYGSGEKLVPMSKAVSVRKKEHKNLENDNNDKSVLSVNKVFIEHLSSGKISEPFATSKSKSIVVDEGRKSPIVNSNVENRFYVTKKVIVGNVSKYLVAVNQKEKDRATHKWMVYVRGPDDEPDISHYVKSVWFFLHPSYIPNDIVQVHKPPFQLTRRGWGEFPIRVQLHFKDSKNKRFDIIHNLKLDKTYTGLQTLGAETIVKLELCRHANDGLFLPLTSAGASEMVKDNTYVYSNNSTLPLQTCEELKVTKNNFDSINETEDAESYGDAGKNEVAELKLDPVTRLKQIEALSSVVSSCVTSAAVSRCTSPVHPHVAKYSITDYETRLILHELARDAPLISSEQDIRLRPFSCLSIELYSKWSFSKRRASEWQRSVFMKRLFIEYIDSYNKALTVPTTKQIMLWCRENGYTPEEHQLQVVLNKDIRFCHLCGTMIENKNASKNMQWCADCVTKETSHCKTQSLTSFTDVFTEIQNKEKALISLNKLQGCSHTDTDLDDDVDVLQFSDDKGLQPVLESSEKLVVVASGPELKWVCDATSELGIHLSSVTINSTRAPVLQAMLYSAVKCFLRDLLCLSHSEAVHECRSTIHPALVTFKHVNTALNKTSQFDFLTDVYMGKADEEDVAVQSVNEKKKPAAAD